MLGRRRDGVEDVDADTAFAYILDFLSWAIGILGYRRHHDHTDTARG
ncbi:hypothetical protein [Nocardia vinacea]|nr:hypothetical protein [Nocardia vinacea]